MDTNEPATADVSSRTEAVSYSNQNIAEEDEEMSPETSEETMPHLG